MPERKGAAYRIKSKRPASSHAEHTQVTHTTGMYEGVETIIDNEHGIWKQNQYGITTYPKPRPGGDFGQGPPLERNPEGRGYRAKRA